MSCQAFSRPRSRAGKASGSPAPRMLTIATVQGPTPRVAARLARSRWSSLPLNWRQRCCSVSRRFPGMGKWSSGSVDNSPAPGNTLCWWSLLVAAARRPQIPRAARVLTCWPMMVRMADSYSDHAPGARIPGNTFSSGASCGSFPRVSAITAGLASRSNMRRTRATTGMSRA